MSASIDRTVSTFSPFFLCGDSSDKKQSRSLPVIPGVVPVRFVAAASCVPFENVFREEQEGKQQRQLVMCVALQACPPLFTIAVRAPGNALYAVGVSCSRQLDASRFVPWTIHVLRMYGHRNIYYFGVCVISWQDASKSNKRAHMKKKEKEKKRMNQRLLSDSPGCCLL